MAAESLSAPVCLLVEQDVRAIPARRWPQVYASLQALKGHIQEYPGFQRFDVYAHVDEEGDVQLHCYTTWDTPEQLEAFLERGYTVERMLVDIGGRRSRRGPRRWRRSSDVAACRTTRPRRPLVGYQDTGRRRPAGRGGVGHPGLAHPRRDRAHLPRLDAHDLFPRARPALARLRHVPRYLSSLEFLTYLAFLAIVVRRLSRHAAGAEAADRTEPYSDAELGAHDRKLAKYFVAGGFFLVLGSVHMVVKNVPWIAESLARDGIPRPPRPRPLEHARHDRRRRDAARHRALLARPAADRRPSACERRARPVCVLAHSDRARWSSTSRSSPTGSRSGGWSSTAGTTRSPRHTGQVVQDAPADRCRNHGPRLLVLRCERRADDLPVPAGQGAEAAVASLEVLRDRARLRSPSERCRA